MASSHKQETRSCRQVGSIPQKRGHLADRMASSHEEESRPRRMAQSHKEETDPAGKIAPHRRETIQQTEWLNPGRRETNQMKGPTPCMNSVETRPESTERDTP
ncbi:hypothetical protein N7447_010001 [Penicillium robsamsonii]|uniref:uncharacterized protein n=1 Tax=Penicillium robsamsonii TaxID=1792511 RepID=UPI002546E4C5|nr:uncharacterized protein N7447_010001 [Penicillium robsamsonii]KAJ5812978.1 hypothetical protein N7447_010001 [Penicillium robsamsonii]